MAGFIIGPSGVAPALASKAFVFKGFTHTNTGTSRTVDTNTMSLGSGSVFVILGVWTQGNTPTAVTVNSAALTLIDNPGGSNVPAIFAGTVTVTGSDSVAVTASGEMSFQDNFVVAFTATGLSSTTAKTHTFNASTSSTTISAAVGDFIFAFTIGGSTQSFTASSQQPDVGDFGTLTPTNSSYFAYAGWTAGAGVSGGNFTVQSVLNGPHTIASWS